MSDCQLVQSSSVINMLRSPNSRPLLIIAVLVSAFIQLVSHWLFPELDFYERLLKFGVVITLSTIFLNALDEWIAVSGAMKWVGPIFGVPYIGGRWEGWKLSDLSPTGVWQPICIEIKQGFFITAQEVGARDQIVVNRSFSMTNGEFFMYGDHPPTLVFTYITKPAATMISDEMIHHGTFLLEFNSRIWPNKLEGKYFHDAKRFGSVPGVDTFGARGSLVLSKSDRALGIGFNLDESQTNSWAAPKPPMRDVRSRSNHHHDGAS